MTAAHSKGDQEPVYESKEARVKLIPRDAWWTALFLDAPRVKRKGRNALGLFIAVNGFTAGARREYSQRAAFLTMDGADLFCVLEGRIPLHELLRRKKRHVNETGNCYFPAQQALAE